MRIVIAADWETLRVYGGEHYADMHHGRVYDNAYTDNGFAYVGNGDVFCTGLWMELPND